jgi:hypothetical protein
MFKPNFILIQSGDYGESARGIKRWDVWPYMPM